MNVTEFAFVGHAVANLQRARTFYENVLKLPPPNRRGIAMNDSPTFVDRIYEFEHLE